jgi:hypothetical protein
MLPTGLPVERVVHSDASRMRVRQPKPKVRPPIERRRRLRSRWVTEDGYDGSGCRYAAIARPDASHRPAGGESIYRRCKYSEQAPVSPGKAGSTPPARPSPPHWERAPPARLTGPRQREPSATASSRPQRGRGRVEARLYTLRAHTSATPITCALGARASGAPNRPTTARAIRHCQFPPPAGAG